LGLCQRRISCHSTGKAFSFRHDFAMPYMTAWTDEARNAQAPFSASLRAFLFVLL
jgi:hypothetical protein